MSSAKAAPGPPGCLASSCSQLPSLAPACTPALRARRLGSRVLSEHFWHNYVPERQERWQNELDATPAVHQTLLARQVEEPPFPESRVLFWTSISDLSCTSQGIYHTSPVKHSEGGRLQKHRSPDTMTAELCPVLCPNAFNPLGSRTV